MLYGVSAFDPVTLAVSCLLLTLVVLRGRLHAGPARGGGRSDAGDARRVVAFARSARGRHTGPMTSHWRGMAAALACAAFTVSVSHAQTQAPPAPGPVPPRAEGRTFDALGARSRSACREAAADRAHGHRQRTGRSDVAGAAARLLESVRDRGTGGDDVAALAEGAAAGRDAHGDRRLRQSAAEPAEARARLSGGRGAEPAGRRGSGWLWHGVGWRGQDDGRRGVDREGGGVERPAAACG